MCVQGGREGGREVTRGGHFKQATTLALASAAVLNDCHVLVVSPSPPLLLLLLLLYVVLAQLVVVVVDTGLLLLPLFVCGYKHIWH